MEKLYALFLQTVGVATDTRKIEKNTFFIALKGENFDGNEYVQAALDKGAKYAITDRKELANDNRIFFVEDTLLFLQKLAEHHRQQFDIPVLGITGTNGKTTTKELIASVLQQKYEVLYTQGNLNNHIGVPLTLLQLKKEHEIAIIEMGASKIGDIKELCDIAHPNYGIITNIGVAHIEGFGSPENIILTKSELYQAVAKRKGHLFYNVDDEILTKQLPQDCTASTYGISQKAEIQSEIRQATPLLSIQWEKENYRSPEIQTQLVGSYNHYNLMAAITVGNYFKVSTTKINAALQNYAPQNNRSQLLKTKHNTLIVDCYNANPTSTKIALENFKLLKNKEKLFILGDMLELGENSISYHKEIIELSKKLHLQGIFVGKEYQKAAQKEDHVLVFETTEKTKSFLATAQPRKNLVLLKGSRGIGLEVLIGML